MILMSGHRPAKLASDIRWYQVLRPCDLPDGRAIIEEAAPDGMGTGERRYQSGISIGQAVFATEVEPISWPRCCNLISAVMIMVLRPSSLSAVDALSIQAASAPVG